MGRLEMLKLADVVTILASLFSMIDMIETIILSRLIIGVCIGINSTIVPVFIKEISPDEISGKMGSKFQVMILLT
jgi:hypothetical protein